MNDTSSVASIADYRKRKLDGIPLGKSDSVLNDANEVVYYPTYGAVCYLQYFQHTGVFPEFKERLHHAVVVATTKPRIDHFTLLPQEVVRAMETISYSEVLQKMNDVSENKLHGELDPNC